MMQPLIGTDGLLTRLSGAIEISLDEDGMQTIIEGRPGVGVPTQRIVINSDKILDVETLILAPRPRSVSPDDRCLCGGKYQNCRACSGTGVLLW